MNKQYYYTHGHSRIQRYKVKRLIILCIASICLIFVACTIFGNLLSFAHGSPEEDPVDFKYYKSIQIQPGDNLWDIASLYITEDYDSVSSYIEEIKEINSLSTDELHAGEYLVIVYNNTIYLGWFEGDCIFFKHIRIIAL